MRPLESRKISRFILSVVLALALSPLTFIFVRVAEAATLINNTALTAASVKSLGGCTGLSASRTELYCNGDGVYHLNNGLTTIPGHYRIDINGSSSNSNRAG